MEMSLLKRGPLSVRAPVPPLAASALLLVLSVALSGCAVELRNTQPAQQLAEQAKTPGSAYTGWRVFQDKCASCHGPAASGTSRAPDLLPRVQNMVSRQFVSLVLQRYEWTIPAGQPSSPGPARDAMIVEMVQRKGNPMTMPAWQGEPTVNAHIVDLYAFLSARAQGTQGPQRPTP